MMLLLLSLAFAPGKPPTDLACTCTRGAEPHTVAEARRVLALMDVVFTGRVLHTSFGSDSIHELTMDGDSVWFRSSTLIATMAVGKVFKGEIPDTVRVETHVETSACGASLEKGERYLISGSPISRSVVATSKCGWTRPLSQAGRLLALLRRTR